MPTLSIRVTDDQLASIKSRAGRIPVSAWAKDQILAPAAVLVDAQNRDVIGLEWDIAKMRRVVADAIHEEFERYMGGRDGAPAGHPEAVRVDGGGERPAPVPPSGDAAPSRPVQRGDGGVLPRARRPGATAAPAPRGSGGAPQGGGQPGKAGPARRALSVHDVLTRANKRGD